jgi:mycofactocin system FadH/OYE family oxidoreductase 2
MSVRFQYLFEPIKIKNVLIPNRIASMPHSTRFAADGLVTERMIAYQKERAKGGVGLIVTEAQSIHPSSQPRLGMILNWNDRVIPGLKRLGDAVHEHGTKIFGQLIHQGRQMTSSITNRPILAPSPIPCPLRREVPKEMELEDIQEIAYSFGQGARRLKEAHFDGAELQGAHGYLLQQFMSPFSNKRNDQYGGSLENRLRFVFEVIGEVRKNVGGDFVVGIRVSGDEFVPGGLTIEDMKEISQRLEATGQIDYISVSLGNYVVGYLTTPPWYIPPGSFVYLAANIKEVVDLPVICVNRINDPILAEKILEDHQADLVGMCRALIADPELPLKAREGRVDEIRNCIGCRQGCSGVATATTPYLACTINPVVGQEVEISSLEPASVKKKILVIGGGPGGLEISRIAAKRGHKVILCEKEKELGGQVALLAKDPIRQEIGGVIRFQTIQLEKLGVETRMGVSVTPEMVTEWNPDVVVLATGSEPDIPSIPGANKDTVVNIWEVLKQQREIGQRVLIIAGGEGHQPPVSVAEFLADQGKKVEVVSTLSVVGADIETNTFKLLYQRLLEKGVILSPMTGVKEILPGEVVVYNVYTKTERRIPVDTVVIASGNHSVTNLYVALKGKVKELYRVGDCLAPRKINNAIYEGYQLGRIL